MENVPGYQGLHTSTYLPYPVSVDFRNVQLSFSVPLLSDEQYFFWIFNDCLALCSDCSSTH